MTLKLYFIPGRSWLPRWLLGELDEPFELIELDAEAKEHKTPEFLAINPLGKLPVLDIDGRIVTETAAICLFLADRRPDKGLSPAFDHPDRGRCLTLVVHAVAALEPSIEDVLLKRKSDPLWVGWQPMADEFAFVEGHLGDGPWLLGESFSVADIVLGGVLVWASGLEIDLPPRLADYVARLKARPVLADLFEQAAKQYGGLGGKDS